MSKIIKIDSLTVVEIETALVKLKKVKSPCGKTTTSIRRLQAELKRRSKVEEEAAKEIQDIPVNHPEFSLLKDEIVLRNHLLVLPRESEAYARNYHALFTVREKGLANGLYRFFVPSRNELWME